MSKQALAIGTFDGVHLGHQAIIKAARQFVGDGGTVTAVTFWPHPLAVLRRQSAPPLLQSQDARAQALLAAGADNALTLDFTPELAALSPADFAERYLTPLDPVAVSVGANFTFGAGGLGTPATLQQLAGGRYSVLTSPIVDVDGQPVSSSRIRQVVLAGEVSQAARLLGRDFAVRGVVVHGDHRGRALGFPTANLLPDDSLVTPADGVYAGWLRCLETPCAQPRLAAVSVGDNPTFGSSRRVEAYVLDFDGDLYGQVVEVGFTRWLRGMITFRSVDELIAQLKNDVSVVAGHNDSLSVKATW